MSRTDAIFTALNQGDVVRALQTCFEDADDDIEEKRFCCTLASRAGISPDEPWLPEALRRWLATCPVVLKR